MGQRGPKSSVMTNITPGRRAELDRKIVEGTQTLTNLHGQYGKPNGISFSAFCRYAAVLRNQFQKHYFNALIGSRCDG